MIAVDPHGHQGKAPYTYQHGPIPDRRPGDTDQISPLIGRLPVPMRDVSSRGRFAVLWDRSVTWFWVVLAIGICLGLPIVGSILRWLT